MEEVWKDIDGYDGYYQVSNFGRVRRTEKKVSVSDKRVGSFQKTCPARILKQTKFSNGYMFVSLYYGGQQKNVSVHRLVATAFILNTEHKPTVNHKNGDKTDNRAKNLEWATYSENQLHSQRVLGRNQRKVIPNTAKRIMCLDSGEIYRSVRDASIHTGVGRKEIMKVCSGKIPQAKNKHFRQVP